MLIDVNLLPPKERKRSPVWLSVLIAVAVVLLVALFFGMIYLKQAEQDRLASELAQTVQLRETLEQTAAGSQTLSAEEQLRQAIQWVEQEQLPATPLLDHLVERLPDRGFFLEVSYVTDEEVALDVQFDVSRDAAYYLAELKKSPWVLDARLLSIEAAEVDVAGSIVPLPRYVASYTVSFDRAALNTALSEGSTP